MGWEVAAAWRPSRGVWGSSGCAAAAVWGLRVQQRSPGRRFFPDAFNLSFLINDSPSILLQPHKKKKPFIEKKKAVTFHLVHRSQKDPLAADDTAPQRVLLPAQRVSACLSCGVRPHGRSYRREKWHTTGQFRN